MSISNPLEITSEVVNSFISNNSVPRDDLPALIQAVHAAIARLAGAPESLEAKAETKAPAVPIRKSVTPDYLICLEDGKKFKSLRRHLTMHGLTAEQYREKWNLPPNYPMIASNYAAVRSALAKQIGLGRNLEANAPRKRGRPPKPANDQ